MLGRDERRAVRVAVASAIAAGLAGLIPACGGAERPGRSAAPGTAAVRLVNRVDAPCEVRSVHVWVGGEVVRLAPAPPRGDAPVDVAEVALSPGEHVVSARVSVRCGGAGAEPEVVVVGAQRRLHLEGGAALLTVGVASPAQPAAGASRIALDLSARGGLLEPEAGYADREQRCADQRSGRRALCRAEADFAIATERKNVVWALCVRDQLGPLRAAADLYDEGRARRDREAVALAEARLGDIARRVEQCAATAIPETDPDPTSR